MISAEQMVDLDRYPIADLERPDSAEFAARCRQTYLETGLCALHGFIRPDALEKLAAEATTLAPKAYFCKSMGMTITDAWYDALSPEQKATLFDDTRTAQLSSSFSTENPEVSG